LGYWRIFELEGLSPEAEKAREKIFRNVAGLSRLAGVQQAQIEASKAGTVVPPKAAQPK
jgi:hypothetical protein